MWLEPRIVRRLVAFDHDRHRQFRGRGFDRRDQFQIVFERDRSAA